MGGVSIPDHCFLREHWGWWHAIYEYDRNRAGNTATTKGIRRAKMGEQAVEGGQEKSQFERWSWRTFRIRECPGWCLSWMDGRVPGGVRGDRRFLRRWATPLDGRERGDLAHGVG